MSERIADPLSALIRQSESTAAAETHETARGFWHGEDVVVERSIADLVDDAKEEVGFFFEEKVESKALEERDVHIATVADSKIDEIQRYLNRLPDFDVHKLKALIDRIRTHGQSIDAILKQVEEAFSEPAHGHAALEMAEELIRREKGSELADRIKAARARMEAERGAAIRAGYNIAAAAAALAGTDRAAAQELRDFYRGKVFKNPGPYGLLKSILDQYGLDELPERIRFLTKAVGDDMSAASPSIEASELQSLLNDLTTLRVLDTVRERCDDLTKRMARVNKVVFTSTEALRNMLPMIEDAAPSANSALSVLDRLGFPSRRLDARISFLREGREVMASMPTNVYRDLDARARALKGFQDAMETLIQKEESGQ